jgi:plastocyanin
MYRTAAAITLALVTLAAAGCGGGDDPNRRTVQIVQADDACSPAAIDLQPGEKIRFEVKNESGKDQEIEGIDGTKLEELLIPSGRTRNLNYTAPSEAGTQKVKCYTPGGASMIIELNVSP